MTAKSKFVGVRLAPEQQRKLIVLSLQAGEPGNMSAALRWLVDGAKMPSMAEAHGAGAVATAQPDRIHA